MVSVTGSVTWISHSPSVICMNPNPRRQGMNGTPIATGRKEPQKRQDYRHGAGKRMYSPPGHSGQGTTPPVHRQVWKKERTSQKEVRMRQSFVSGRFCPLDSLPSRIYFGSKEKESSARLAASDGFSTISATLSTLSIVCWTSVFIPIHTSISKPFLTWRYSM